MWSEKIARYITENSYKLSANGITMDPERAVHPTFLYESVWCLLGFVVLYIITRKARKFSGQIFLIYGIWYGAERAVVEGFRTDSLYITGTTIRVSQVLSAVLAVVCLVILICLLVKYKKHPKPIDGVDYFLEDELKKLRQNAAELASIEAQLSDVKKYIELEKLLPAAEAKKSAAQTRLAELLTYAEKARTAIDGINAEILTLSKAQADVDELKEQYAEAVAALTVDNTRIEELDQQAGHGRRQMEEIETAEAKLEVLRRQATEQGQLAAGYEELKRAFSQDGIPHNIVRSIVPLFEATATSIISQMSGGHMSIEMRMEKTLKSNSKKEVTALDVIVNDAATGALPYMSRSGGERVKAALSVILALAELKSSTAGVQLGFLFIDEPPFLDDKGVQAYCDALEAIQKRYSSLKIMAITHDPEMKARFPQAVDVVKTAEGSKVIYS